MKTLRHELPHGSHPQPLGASVKRQRPKRKQQTKKEKKQSILTGENRHRNDNTNRQQLTRHSSQPAVFYFFLTAHFLKTNKRSDSRVPIKDKLNKRVILSHPASGTFGFARHTSRPFAKPKEPLFCQRTFKDNTR